MPAFARAPPNSPINEHPPPQTHQEPSTSASQSDQGLDAQSSSTTPSEPNSATSVPHDATSEPQGACCQWAI